MRARFMQKTRLLWICLTVAIALASCQKAADQKAAESKSASTVVSATLPPGNVSIDASNKDWTAFHNGGPLRGEGAPLGPPPMRVRWTFHCGQDEVPATQPSTQPSAGPGHFEGSAAIVAGVVYAGDTGGVLNAIDLKTGKAKWSYRVEDGFATTPLVLGDKVLLGDLSGVFHAVSASTGTKLWTFDAGGSPIHSSANYEGNRIVFGTDGADVFCLDANTGKQLWTQRAGDRINGAPAIAQGAALVSGCDAHLRGMRLSDGHEDFDVEIGSLCPGSAASADGRLVLGTDQGRVLCLSADKHEQLWLFQGIGNQAMVYSSPAIAGGIVVVGARDRNVYGIDLATGKKLWNFPTRGDVDSSAAISNGRVYIASRDKKLYVLDLKSGKELWQFSASRAIIASPAIAEGVLVIGDTAGNLYCLEPTGAQ